ncbi:MAG: N-acetyl-alpha-D-glucosaminyl L-malate synthase BshA [Gemmatimonadetes bacterium]|nr:MAG: N-acetyl-alpha-D-glucosaminyl L-malate synthase BshA [Gemmatimonadota bacterium]
MKIGITCYPTYGGSGIIATELGKELANRGHAVHFISYAMPARLHHYFHENIFFHEVEVMKYPLFEYQPYAISLAAKMSDIIRHENLDLLHVHYAIPHATSGYLAQQIVGADKVKVITTLHGTDITIVGTDASFLPITQFSIEKSDGVTTVSEWMRQETIRTLQIQRPIEVIPNFIDTDLFSGVLSRNMRRCQLSRGKKVLIHISNFRPVKRIKDVVDIFYRVQQEVDAILLMVGDGPERVSSETYCRQLKICDKIRYLGKQDGIPDLLALSDLMLFPSEHESFGLSALEAMSSGVPVIGSNAGGLREVVLSGETGYLAEVGDVDTMADYAIRLLKDHDLRREMGRKGREHALRSFSPQVIIPRYEAYYQRILDQ